jgi:hypothetical protein
MNRRTIGVLAILTVIFLTACNSQTPQIALEMQSFEFGDVVNGTIAEKDISITNRGRAPLTLEEIATSCGCTTAEVNLTTIQPGESAVLHIEFDSGAHGPEMTGELMREVFMRTNDPQSPEVLVTFTVNVIK